MPDGREAALDVPAVLHLGSAYNAATSRSTSSAEWAAEREIRKRAVPAGTVGGRIAGTQIPCSRNFAIKDIAVPLSPTTSG
jgi:hypothetical protein